ncbi:MAG: CAP domain-containing protein [Caldilineaceae bacterium]
MMLTKSQTMTLLALLLSALLIPRHSTLYAAATFTGCGGDYVTATHASNEAKVVELVNEERAKQGLSPLKYNGDLSEAARYHAADMAADQYSNHDTYDRVNDVLTKICTATQRTQKYYTYNKFTENIGNGTSSPQTIMQAWMASSGHRANILGDYRELGVGYAQLYWVQDFTTTNNVYPLIIDREAQQTTQTAVTLYIYGTWNEIRLRNDGGAWSDWQPFQTEMAWTLAANSGTRLVEAELRRDTTVAGASDTIELVLPNQAPTATATPTATPQPTQTPTMMSTATPSATPTQVELPTATPTATSTVTPTATPTMTAVPLEAAGDNIYLPIVVE